MLEPPKPAAKRGAVPKSGVDETGTAEEKLADVTVEADEHMLEQHEAASAIQGAIRLPQRSLPSAGLNSLLGTCPEGIFRFKLLKSIERHDPGCIESNADKELCDVFEADLRRVWLIYVACCCAKFPESLCAVRLLAMCVKKMT